MAAYNVYMVKLGSVTVDEGAVGGTLRDLFNRVINSSRGLRTRFDAGTAITWTTTCPAPQAWELLIYVVASSLDSVVSTLGGSPSGDGLTSWRGDVTGSEVYVNASRGDNILLAKLAFHEAMHNKKRWTDAQLHPTGGLAGSPITAATPLTDANIALMAAVLGRNRPQWTGGCAAYNDPLRGL